MKRVLVIIPNLDLGGMETVVMNYFRHIDRSRLVFDFVLHGEKGYFEDEASVLGARIFRAPTRKQGFFKNVLAMKKIYSRKEYDTVIVCTEHALAFIELAVAWACGVRTRAAWSHFADYQGRSRVKRSVHFLARPFLYMFANLFFACTKDAGRWLFSEKFVKNLHKKNFHIINNAIDMQRFKYDPETRERLRSEMGLGARFAVGIIGRLVPVKNHAFAMDVMQAMPKPDDVALVIIGDGELRAELEARAGENVIFTGAVGNVHDYLQALDAVIVPSLHEGLSIAAIEAQAAGLPVLLSSNIPPEAAICETARFLENCVGVWVGGILGLMDGGSGRERDSELKSDRKSDRREIDLADSGFDIRKEADRIMDIFGTNSHIQNRRRRAKKQGGFK
ncbi:MAG: glycosyltransferase [Defluviitaleaceae bacterium]|nr:glycosyltransferase [Defluviitaleaceae bacterium]